MTIEVIAVFHTGANWDAAWGCAEGVVDTLVDLGYRVINCGNPNRQRVSIELLQTADLILICSPEWIGAAIIHHYGNIWRELPAYKAAWYVESEERDDRTFDFGKTLDLADINYFPAKQDADKLGGEWLPFGVDSNVFYPRAITKRYNAGFLGQLYPKRMEYISKINFPIVRMNAVRHSDIKYSFNLLAESYCSTLIFVNLPSYSRLLVTKVTEVMACGTMLVTPKVDHPSGAENLRQFTDRKHLVYYDPKHPSEIGDIVKHYVANPGEREEIARNGLIEIEKGHTLRNRLNKIVSDARFARASSEVGRRPANEIIFVTSEPAPAASYEVVTFHNTFVGVNIDTGRLCHDANRATHPPIKVSCENGVIRFFYVDRAGASRRPFRIISSDGDISKDNADLPSECYITNIGVDLFAFSNAGNFLSADADGLVRNDRNWCADWECFRLIPAQ